MLSRRGQGEVREVLDQAQELFGGGALSPLLIAGGIAALWIAWKAVKFVMRLVALAVGVFLLVSIAPWSGADTDGRVADCARAAVEAELGSWQTTITKRVTVEELDPSAACASGDVGLRAGTAVVKLRSFYDIPFQTWDVAPSSVEPRIDLPDSIPTELPGRGGDEGTEDGS